MKLSEELKWRGFVNQTTYQDPAVLDGEKITFYFGVDPSADSMTIGNLASAMMVRHFIEHGHKAILLVGGATGMIGDPDGKATERDLLTLEQLEANKKNIADQYRQVFAGRSFELVDNYDWFKKINYLDFLRDVGKHVPMRQMMGREFVQSRLSEDGAGISYAEFSYSLIQGYDFLHLYRTKKATLQLAGADQWGNSIAGVDLIRRVEGGEAHVWTAPLIINKATGKKFGKSEEGAVWIDSEKTSPYKFYQFWLNVDDAGVIDYMKIYTLLSKGEIEDVENKFNQNPSDRFAQKTLAYEVTKLVHGEAKAESARNVTATLFGDTPFEQLLDEDIEMLAQEIPVTSAGNLLDALIMSSVVGSKGEARRLLSQGAISVNDKKVSDDMTLSAPSLIKKGKNTFLLVR